MNTFFRRLFHLQIQRPVILFLIMLAWSIPAFCGEIHDAAREGDLKKVQTLLEDNLNLVLSKDRHGLTSLYWTAMQGHKDVAELLLANNADVNTMSSAGWTPLHLAARYGHKDVVESLLANKADVNARDNDSSTPLHWAVLKGYKDVAELLRQHGGCE
jgi:ankyrin repeat protein